MEWIWSMVICSWQALDKSMQAGGPDKSELTKYLDLVCRFVYSWNLLHLQAELGAIKTLFLIKK